MEALGTASGALKCKSEVEIARAMQTQYWLFCGLSEALCSHCNLVGIGEGNRQGRYDVSLRNKNAG